MSSHILTDGNPLPTAMLRELANSSVFAEISNGPNGVRHHIFHFANRDKQTGKTQRSIGIAIYQTRRHGPQNGYRLCLVHEGYYIASPEKKEGEPEDEIDRLERPIPQGHEEMVIIGSPFWLGLDGEEAEGGRGGCIKGRTIVVVEMETFIQIKLSSVKSERTRIKAK
ncbi:uncharacterized protein PG986_004092 [Apiospora aurea]|uniref:Uncharacterized protein n=1 Tax=Apiospora aurea TaxID=335848 RepID=A0ABR1QLK8_9PEZI